MKTLIGPCAGKRRPTRSTTDRRSSSSVVIDRSREAAIIGRSDAMTTSFADRVEDRPTPGGTRDDQDLFGREVLEALPMRCHEDGKDARISIRQICERRYDVLPGKIVGKQHDRERSVGRRRQTRGEAAAAACRQAGPLEIAL